ncbi:tetratricopeptide repeat protein [Granulosicoccus sp. 3-233]|uniref:tetratricopeptide repeat protein n=1 Tax=Granulosicoccus sp. 3-233 TaxID=3417969 RepID=UPI003D3456E4
MKPNQSLILLLVGLLASCATPPAPDSNTVRLCDSSGCEEVDKSTARFDPSSTVPDADPEGRMPALEKLAKEDPRAAHDLALRLFRGDGVRRNSYQALQWMRDAAERGDLGAQKAVGRLYLTGLEEMGAAPREAEKWLTIAAGRGDKEAEELLAEASAARQNEDAAYQLRTRWRPVFYNSWYSGYRYYWRWVNGIWIY